MPQGKAYAAMLHGAATDKLPLLCGQRGRLDPYTRTLIVEGEGITLSGITEPCRISTHKLLCAAGIRFTQVNHTGAKERRINTRLISITLREYAEMLGMQSTVTTLKNLRKSVNRDLALLGSALLSWTETIRGKTVSHINVHIAESCGIRRGVIEVTLSEHYADWLICRPLMQYPTALLELDERSAVAYRLGYKLALHGTNSHNQHLGTAGTVRVATLLKYIGLADIDELRSKEQSYIYRLAKPLTAALETLVRCGVLAKYSLCGTDRNRSFAEWCHQALSFVLNGLETT
ncbi:hypothetical protein SAMN02910317_01195 [Ruminococcaceae bacterium FB2012]|nr:hypothetical protein SAMN02910317_01195 [Ruminococcaceae bacterium FB2012]